MKAARSLQVAPLYLYDEALGGSGLHSFARQAETWGLNADHVGAALYSQKLVDWEYMIDEVGANGWLNLKREDSIKGDITRALYDRLRGCAGLCDTIINRHGVFFVYAYMRAATDAGEIPTMKDYMQSINRFLTPDKKTKLFAELAEAIAPFVSRKKEEVLAAMAAPFAYRCLTPYISYLREGHGVQSLLKQIRKLDPDDNLELRFYAHPCIDVKLNTDLLITHHGRILNGVGVTMDSKLAKGFADGKNDFRKFDVPEAGWDMVYLLVETDISHTMVNTVSEEQVERVAKRLFADATLLDSPDAAAAA
jgi:hypothetical protein